MRVLFAFYSRTGTTKKACRRIAALLEAEGVEVQVEEIVDLTNRSGAFGHARGGVSAVLEIPTETQPVEAQVAAFDVVVIGTPVWGMTCAPAARAFCEEHAEQLREVAFVVTMQGIGEKGALRALERHCGREPVATVTLVERDVHSGSLENFREPMAAFAQELIESVSVE